MKRIHLFLAAATLAAGTFAGTAATAGARFSSEVYVSSIAIRGSMLDARASSDSLQHISCTLYRSGTSESGYCSARDAAGNYKGCSTTSGSNQNDAIRSITPDSTYLSVYLNSGYCTSVAVTQGSARMD